MILLHLEHAAEHGQTIAYVRIVDSAVKGFGSPVFQSPQPIGGLAGLWLWKQVL